MKNKFYIIIGVSLLIITGVVAWGMNQQLRFDEFALKHDGIVLNEDLESVQFTSNDSIYRNWASSQVLLTDDAATKNVLADNALLFFQNNAVMLLDKSPIIDVAGVARNADAFAVYEKKSDVAVNESNNKIKEHEVVKLGNRQYYAYGNGDIYVDGEKVEHVEDPMFLIDKTGSVSVIAENGSKKHRYIGQLEFKMDDTHRIDVSDEMYYVGENEIDLSSYGGTDNEKFVVKKPEDDKELSKAEEEEEKKKASEGTGSGSGSGAGSTGSNKANTAANLPSAKDINDLNSRIADINAKSNSRKIPIVQLSSKIVTTTGLDGKLFVSDPSNTLVGQLEFTIHDGSDTIVQSTFVDGVSTTVNIAGLQPNTQYTMKLAYSYDLGDGKGMQRIQVPTDVFTTQTVSALYQFNSITSSSFTTILSLDSGISDIKKAEALIYNANSNALHSTLQVDIRRLNTTGSILFVDGLSESTNYRVVLKVELLNGKTITFLGSKNVATGKLAALRSFEVVNVDQEQYKIQYDVDMPEFDILDVNLKANPKAHSTLEEVKIETLANHGQSIFFVPVADKQEENREEANLDLEINFSVRNKLTQKKSVFTYEVGSISYFNENVLELVKYDDVMDENSEQVESDEAKLVFHFLDGKKDIDYQVVFQNKVNDKWQKISSEDVVFNGTQHLFESQVSKVGDADTYRVLVYNQSLGLVSYSYIEKNEN